MLTSSLAATHRRRDPRRHIGLIMSEARGYSADVVSGVLEYARTHRSWRFTMLRADWQPGWELPFRPDDQPDGVLAYVVHADLVALLQALGKPVVNVAAIRHCRPFPLVYIDDHAVGRLGAEHLLQTGFEHFAYLGLHRAWFSLLRGAGFRHALRQHGHDCQVGWCRSYDHEIRTGSRKASLVDWIVSLPKPVAIMASTDREGIRVLDACRQVGLNVPEQVAVLGVDNDVILCEICDPPLSSINNRVQRVGYRAAELLDDLISGQPAPAEPILLPPGGVITRTSTDAWIGGTDAVAAAVRYIRANADRPIAVKDVLHHIACNRRSLERGFQRSLQRSPHDEILRAHVERAKQLLAETDLLIAQVATASGFQYQHHFSTVFRRLTGQSPSDYRRQFQLR